MMLVVLPTLEIPSACSLSKQTGTFDVIVAHDTVFHVLVCILKAYE